MTQQIIWISGYAGAGKDTMASILCKKYDFQRVAFADSLKDIVAAKYGFDRALCDSPVGKNYLCFFRVGHDSSNKAKTLCN